VTVPPPATARPSTRHASGSPWIATVGAHPRIGRLAPLALVAGLTVTAFLIRLAALDQSLFADELFTYRIATRDSPADVVREVQDTAITPPLHYLLAWGTGKLGEPKIWIRVPSLILGAATVPLVYLVGLRTVGRTAGLMGAALIALSPFAAFYSTEARPYAALSFLVGLSTLALLGALQTSRRRWWVLFAVSSCLALYAHYTAVFVLAAQGLWALVAGRDRVRSLALAYVAVALGYLPWVPSFLEHRRSSGTNAIAVFNPFSPRTLAEGSAKLVPGHPFVPLDELPGMVALGLLLLTAVAMLAGTAVRIARRRRAGRPPRPSPAIVLVVMLALATPVGIVAYNLVGPSIYAPRNLLASLPAACLGLGAWIASCDRPVRMACVALVAVALAISSLRSLDADFRRPPANEAAELVDAEAGPDDLVIQLVAFRSPRAPPGLIGSVEVNFELRHRFLQATLDDRRAFRIAARHRRLFVVAGGLPGFGRTPPPPLERGFRLLSARGWRGFAPVAVFVYATPGSARPRPPKPGSVPRGPGSVL
jgi:hypothetical protein